MCLVNEKTILLEYLQEAVRVLDGRFEELQLVTRACSDLDKLIDLEVDQLREMSRRFYYVIASFEIDFPRPEVYLRLSQQADLA